MKKRYLPILLLLLLLASCFKYIKVDNSIKYTVLGFRDVTIDQNDSGILYVSVELLSGDPTNEYITFKVSGIPDSVLVNNDSLTFRPNYGFPLVFHAHAPKPGVYPVTVTMSAPTIGTKIYTFNLTVTSFTDCTNQFSQSQTTSSLDSRHEVQMPGTYGSNLYAYVQRTACDTLHIQVMKDSMEPGSEPDGVQIMVAEFSAFVNCSANSLSVFPQSAKWLQQPNELIRGSGTYVPLTTTTATITINDTVYSGSQISTTNTIIIY